MQLMHGLAASFSMEINLSSEAVQLANSAEATLRPALKLYNQFLAFCCSEL